SWISGFIGILVAYAHLCILAVGYKAGSFE
ncbi:glycosyl transferase, partial [Pseudomonas aeruginosa]|nr:glycosyl transferase [Pseudomonas aeruginosa]